MGLHFNTPLHFSEGVGCIRQDANQPNWKDKRCRLKAYTCWGLKEGIDTTGDFVIVAYHWPFCFCGIQWCLCAALFDHCSCNCVHWDPCVVLKLHCMSHCPHLLYRYVINYCFDFSAYFIRVANCSIRVSRSFTGGLLPLQGCYAYDFDYDWNTI